MSSRSWTGRFRRNEGQTMAEYAIVLGVIVPSIILAFALLSGSITAAYTRVIAFF